MEPYGDCLEGERSIIGNVAINKGLFSLFSSYRHIMELVLSSQATNDLICGVDLSIILDSDLFPNVLLIILMYFQVQIVQVYQYLYITQ